MIDTFILPYFIYAFIQAVFYVRYSNNMPKETLAVVLMCILAPILSVCLLVESFGWVIRWMVGAKK